jgi:hypothetical protein
MGHVVSDLKLTVTNWGEVALDKRELAKVMRSAGNTVRSKTARLINASNGGGKRYFGPAGRYQASSPGAPPVRVSGDLRGSLKTYVFKSGEGFAVRAREFYALFLEVGARGGGNPGANARINRRTGRRMRARGVYHRRVLEPRPFLDRVMNEQADELDRRVRAAIDHGLTWKETKGR